MKSITPTMIRPTARFEGRPSGESARAMMPGPVRGAAPLLWFVPVRTASPQRGQVTGPAGDSDTGMGALQYGQAIVGMAILNGNQARRMHRAGSHGL
jgi:hypothetical protein